MTRWVALILLLLVRPVAGQLMSGDQGFTPASALSHEQMLELFDEANEAFRTGLAMRGRGESAADEQFERSIALYHRIIEEGQVRNGKLEYNIANAYLLSGDIGRAILHYRRGQQLLPNDENLAANLAQARARVPHRIPLEASRRLLHTIFFLHYDVPARVRYWIFVATIIAAWAVLLLRLTVLRSLPAIWITPLLLLVSSSLLVSVLIEERSRRFEREGVIVAEALIGRKGPDAGAYQPSFTEPLHAGVEFQILEQRDQWILAQLRDGRETWLPLDGISEVNDRDG